MGYIGKHLGINWAKLWDIFGKNYDILEILKIFYKNSEDVGMA